MENPATWGRAERVVAKAIKNFQDQTVPQTAGLSLVRQITDALRADGLLSYPNSEPFPRKIELFGDLVISTEIPEDQ